MSDPFGGFFWVFVQRKLLTGTSRFTDQIEKIIGMGIESRRKGRPQKEAEDMKNKSVPFFSLKNKSVPFFSFYPGSGHLHEVGAGFGEGYTINVPLPETAGDIAFEKAFREILLPAAEYFEPDLVLVSAGFDPHHNDMAMNLSYDGFKVLTSIVQGIADQYCDGRLVLVLEGGYNLTSLSRGGHAVLEVLAGGDAPELQECGVKEVTEAAEFHRSAFTRDE
ncbi:hypothetical protein Q9L42_016765 [Methylomarinum sp. Ch1-1]|uniref:Histone deacetylase domain-containing protein n=1 Tax=Methylomarinum roseum TaxID=3067653 RepID=A0AAU7NSR0_9GAMM